MMNVRTKPLTLTKIINSPGCVFLREWDEALLPGAKSRPNCFEHLHKKTFQCVCSHSTHFAATQVLWLVTTADGFCRLFSTLHNAAVVPRGELHSNPFSNPSYFCTILPMQKIQIRQSAIRSSFARHGHVHNLHYIQDLKSAVRSGASCYTATSWNIGRTTSSVWFWKIRLLLFSKWRQRLFLSES